MHVHTYPVDPALTAAQAWAEICRFGRRATYTGPETWANRVCDGVECARIADNRGQAN